VASQRDTQKDGFLLGIGVLSLRSAFRDAEMTRDNAEFFVEELKRRDLIRSAVLVRRSSFPSDG